MLFLENAAPLAIFLVVLVGFGLFTIASSYNLIQWTKELIVEQGNNFSKVITLLRRERQKYEHIQKKSSGVFASSAVSLVAIGITKMYFGISIPSDLIYSLIFFVLLSLALIIALDRVINFCRTYKLANTS